MWKGRRKSGERDVRECGVRREVDVVGEREGEEYGWKVRDEQYVSVCVWGYDGGE